MNSIPARRSSGNPGAAKRNITGAPTGLATTGHVASLLPPSAAPAAQVARSSTQDATPTRPVTAHHVQQLVPAPPAKQSQEQAIIERLVAARTGSAGERQAALAGLPGHLREQGLLHEASGARGHATIALRSFLRIAEGLVAAQPPGAPSAHQQYFLQCHQRLLAFRLAGRPGELDPLTAAHALVRHRCQAPVAGQEHALATLLFALRTARLDGIDAAGVWQAEIARLCGSDSIRSAPASARQLLWCLTAAETDARIPPSEHLIPLLASFAEAPPSVLAAAVQGFTQAREQRNAPTAETTRCLRALLIRLSPTEAFATPTRADGLRLAAAALGMGRAAQELNALRAQLLHAAVRSLDPKDLEGLEEGRYVITWTDPLLAGALAFGYCLGLSERADGFKRAGWKADASPQAARSRATHNRMVGIATRMVQDPEAALGQAAGQRGQDLHAVAQSLRKALQPAGSATGRTAPAREGKHPALPSPPAASASSSGPREPSGAGPSQASPASLVSLASPERAARSPGSVVVHSGSQPDPMAGDD